MGGRGASSHLTKGGGGQERYNLSKAKAFLIKAYGEQHAANIMAIIKKAPGEIQSLWADYADQFRTMPIPEGKPIGSAAYQPLADAVYLDIDYVSKGDSISPPYSTVFHEFGHMTDYLIARSYDGMSPYMAFSQIYLGNTRSGNAYVAFVGENGLLAQTAKKELESHLQRQLRQGEDRISRSSLAQRLVEEVNSKYSELDRSDLSDIFEGAGIGFAYPLGTGHGLSYWNNRDPSKEIFAEITAASASHPGSLAAMEEYIPQTVQVYRDMLKGRKKK